MNEVYIVFEHEIFGYDSEVKDAVLVTSDYDKAVAKENEIDSRIGRQWASIAIMELVE